MSPTFIYDKNIFATNLLRLMAERGDKQADVANYLGVSKSTVSDYCKGKQIPRMDKVEALARRYRIKVSELLEEYTAPPKNIVPIPATRLVPLLGQIACGEPILAEENIEEEVDLPEHINADFALRCKGDSMIDARIHDGDIVYIKQQPTVHNGEIAAVLIDDEATLKRVYISPGTLILQPANPDYQPMVYSGEQLEEVRILGKVVGFTSVDI